MSKKKSLSKVAKITTYEEARLHFPACLIGSTADDDSAITCEAKQFGEDPLSILKGLVETELDLIAEGQEAADYYTAKEVREVKRYFARLAPVKKG